LLGTEHKKIKQQKMAEISNEEIYPNIRESWRLVGTIILFQFLFSPIVKPFETTLGKELTFLISYVLIMGITFVIIHRKRINRQETSNYDFGIGSIKIVLLLCFATVAIQIGITFPIISQIPMPDFIQKIFLDDGSSTGVYSFIAIVIAAPILEELLFRGIVLNGLLKSYSPIKSIIISSLLFGLVHLNPWQGIGAFILGSLAGWVYFKTNKLTLPIIIHMTNNFLAFLVGYFNSRNVNLTKSISEYSLTELYGGTTNLIVILTVAITIALSSIYLLDKEFRKK
jgi:membrane protease YdiL (CAAX protease family)